MYALYRALLTELERNLDIASSTRKLVRDKRDMLQGDVQQRLVLHRFHTAVWDAVVARGALEHLPEPETVAACYERVQEINEVVDKFDAEGDAIVHSPLISREGERYGRDNVVDIVAELCGEADSMLHDAYGTVEALVDRTCPVCGDVFEDADACQEHVSTAHA